MQDSNSGSFEFHTRVFPLGDGERFIRVWLPPGYDPDGSRTYPVIYAFDGQNLFAPETACYGKAWQLDQTLTRLRADYIVVGLDCPGEQDDEPLHWTIRRFIEYSAFDFQHPEQGTIHAGGKALIDFLLEQLMPWLEASYRIDPARRTLLGSSMGGQLGLFALSYRPGVFQTLIAMSHATCDVYGGARLRDYIGSHGIEPQARIYLDMGDQEQTGMASPEQWLEGHAAMLKTLEGVGARIESRIEPGAVHDETAWARRFAELASGWLQD